MNTFKRKAEVEAKTTPAKSPGLRDKRGLLDAFDLLEDDQRIH